MKAVIGVLIAVIVLGGGYYFYSQSSDTGTTTGSAGDAMEKDGDAMMEKDGDAMEKDGDAMMEKHGDGAMMEKKFDISGTLLDVSGDGGSGTAKAGYADGTYTLVANFANLPEPEGTDFYEGWVVRRDDNMSVISTGRVNEEEGGYVNLYTSSDNLLDHDFYVLTLEPDDGDPAPAKHIVEGVMQ